MPIMGKHAPAEAANTRARVSAWAVFISMAATTMSFQVYHSIEHGKMPWPLAGLYGIIPLLISMLLIEFVSGWDDAPAWIRPAAYLVIGGAMYLSAAATGAVVLHAAPLHSSLLFGLLLDGAAILAARFLMTTAKVTAAATQAAAVSALEAERSARLDAEAERDEARQDADEAACAAASAAAQAEEAVAKAAEVARQLAEATRKPPRKRTPKPAGNPGGNEAGNDSREMDPVTVPGGDAPEDLDSEARVLWYLDKGLSASAAGVAAGLTDGRGRQIARLRRPAPRGGDEGGSS